MNSADRIRLRHMLDAAQEAMAFAQGHAAEDLRNNRMLLLSLVKEIEIIGEAASQLSQEFRDAHAGVPWAGIRGMRSRLIHAYSEVNIDVVWTTVVSRLPELVRVLESLLAEE